MITLIEAKAVIVSGWVRGNDHTGLRLAAKDVDLTVSGVV